MPTTREHPEVVKRRDDRLTWSVTVQTPFVLHLECRTQELKILTYRDAAVNVTIPARTDNVRANSLNFTKAAPEKQCLFVCSAGSMTRNK